LPTKPELSIPAQFLDRHAAHRRTTSPLLLLLDATATLPGNKCALFASAQGDATKKAQDAAMAFKLCHSTKKPHKSTQQTKHSKHNLCAKIHK
jgi:hypothetical protein